MNNEQTVPANKSAFLKPSAEDWLILEDKIDESNLRFQETIFTLGNGYIGSRGILEEGHSKGYAGTYIAGVYDRGEGESYEIVNIPNPVNVEILINGKKLSTEGMELIQHQRILDTQKAVLRRHSIFSDTGGRYEYESMRFFSLSDMHLGATTFSMRLLDADSRVVVKTTIDGATRNEIRAAGEPIQHYTVTQRSTHGDEISYLEAKTNDLDIVIGVASAGEMEKPVPESGVTVRSYTEGESTVQEFSFEAKKGDKYQFNSYISIYSSRELKLVPKKDCINGVKMARRQGISGLLKRHVKAWALRWEDSDIEVVGDPQSQKALRFDMYHLLIAAPPQDIDVSIAPKALSSEWYNGHIFWDTEIHVFPFFIYTQPKVARDFLMYRYRRLQKARQAAESRGYEGALWPWESAASGEDETPQTWVNFDGTKIPVYNSLREHHIASDIAYAVLHYYEASGDEEFMLRYGAEMIFETARFWASRATYESEKQCYEIKEAIGPNEFQESVDNNSYSNYLAKWVLSSGSELYYTLRNKHPHLLKALAERIKLQNREADNWKEMAGKIVFLTDSHGLIEEFEGYFGRKDVTINEWDENNMPVWPSTVRLAEVKRTQLVKQADVLLLLHLFSNDFSLDAKKINLEYYEKRTVHKSSLSIPSYAITALETGDIEKAFNYFTLAVNSDLHDIYRNTDHGMHAAALAGAWQIAIYGFGGIRLRKGELIANPALPNRWQKMRFRLRFKGSLIEFAVSNNETKVIMLKGQKTVNIELYGNRYCLEKGKRIHARRK